MSIAVHAQPLERMSTTTPACVVSLDLGTITCLRRFVSAVRLAVSCWIAINTSRGNQWHIIERGGELSLDNHQPIRAYFVHSKSLQYCPPASHRFFYIQISSENSKYHRNRPGSQVSTDMLSTTKDGHTCSSLATPAVFEAFRILEPSVLRTGWAPPISIMFGPIPGLMPDLTRMAWHVLD